ncbi:hypothetical protein M0R04_09425 [Candidatus Dojkabacteria bacterium]|jgi:hypothetical protein|nr:hypothetical protein [Candidatus Dojkabacteria bacterium]
MIFPLHIVDQQETWKKAKHVAIEEGITMRVLILRAIKEYIKTRPPLSYQQAGNIPENLEEAQQMAKDALNTLKGE